MSNFTFDLPDELKKQIEAAAIKEHRKIGPQIVHILEQQYPAPADPSEVLNKQDDSSN